MSLLTPDAYDSAAQPGTPPPLTRVYLPTGHYAHLRLEDGSYDILCERARRPCCFTGPCCCPRALGVVLSDDLFGAICHEGSCACWHVPHHAPEDWLGTGSQTEYDKAASLPLCPRCFAMRERRLS